MFLSAVGKFVDLHPGAVTAQPGLLTSSFRDALRYAVWHCYCNRRPVERSSGGITPWLTAGNVAIGGFGRQHADHVPKLICVNARDVCALFDDRIHGNWFLRPCGYIPQRSILPNTLLFSIVAASSQRVVASTCLPVRLRYHRNRPPLVLVKPR